MEDALGTQGIRKKSKLKRNRYAIKKDIKNPLTRDAFDLFAHGTYLRALLKGTPDVQKNLTAPAKAANNARKLPSTRSG